MVPRVRGRNAVKNRSIVLERGMRFGQKIWPPLFGDGKLFRVPLLDGVLDVLIEFGGPRICRVGQLPIHFVQIVNQVAAAKDEDAALAHFLQLAPERQMLGEGARLVQAHLKHLNIGLRIHVAQDAPRAVIESPLLVRGKMVLESQALGLFGSAGSGILHLVERLGEAIKVVNRARPLCGEDLTAASDPMRGNHTDGLRPRQILPKLFERTSKGVRFNSVHGRTVSHEHDWHLTGRWAVGHGYEFDDSRKNLEYKKQCNFPWDVPL